MWPGHHAFCLGRVCPIPPGPKRNLRQSAASKVATHRGTPPALAAGTEAAQPEPRPPRKSTDDPGPPPSPPVLVVMPGDESQASGTPSAGFAASLLAGKLLSFRRTAEMCGLCFCCCRFATAL